MKAHHILIYLGTLALLLVVALVGGHIDDESRRVEFSTWIPLAILAVVFLAWRFAGRSKRAAAAPEPQLSVASPDEPASVPDGPINIQPVLLLVVTAGALVILAWVCLIHLATVGAEGSQTTALVGIRIATAGFTTATAILLSRSPAAWRSPKPVLLQLGALLQIVLAFVGLIIMPIVALIVWNGRIDFQTYSHRLGLLLMLLPTAAVIFCLTRGGGSKR
jgi:hypothetical protein